MKLRPKSLSNCLYYISSINLQNLFGCAIEKIHQEYRQIGITYIGKIEIYLNVTKTEDIIADRELKPSQTSNAIFAVCTNLGLNTLLFRVQIKPHMMHFQI